jgi:dTMP kinase
MQGRLIVFEGVEGCGKTTQIQRSLTWLTQHPLLQRLQAQGHLSQIIVTREPGGTEVGQIIRQLLLHPATAEPIHAHTELLLYAADRAQHVETMLKPLLQSGALILCDRFTDSTIAYQGFGRGLDLQLIEQLNHIATQGLQSDLTLWLHLDVAVGLERTRNRGQRDRLEQTELSFHQRVQQGFVTLAQQYPERIVSIAADCSETEVSHQIQTVLQQHLQQWYSPFLSQDCNKTV